MRHKTHDHAFCPACAALAAREDLQRVRAPTPLTFKSPRTCCGCAAKTARAYLVRAQDRHCWCSAASCAARRAARTEE